MKNYIEINNVLHKVEDDDSIWKAEEVDDAKVNTINWDFYWDDRQEAIKSWESLPWFRKIFDNRDVYVYERTFPPKTIYKTIWVKVEVQE